MPSHPIRSSKQQNIPTGWLQGNLWWNQCESQGVFTPSPHRLRTLTAIFCCQNPLSPLPESNPKRYISTLYNARIMLENMLLFKSTMLKSPGSVVRILLEFLRLYCKVGFTLTGTFKDRFSQLRQSHQLLKYKSPMGNHYKVTYETSINHIYEWSISHL